MEILHQFVSCLLPLGLLVACVYLVVQVRKATEQFRKFERLFRSLREANTKTRFGITGLKDRVALIETLMDDFQTQLDIVLQNKQTEVNHDNDNNTSDSADSGSNP